MANKCGQWNVVNGMWSMECGQWNAGVQLSAGVQWDAGGQQSCCRLHTQVQ